MTLFEANQILRRRNEDLQVKVDRLMMTRAPSEDELLRLTEELNAARSHVMSSRRRTFEYIDRISELEATRRIFKLFK